jgi:anti-anti-sigma factor
MNEIVEIIQPSGQLDDNNLNLLHNEIVIFLARGVKLILIDFQDVTFIGHDNIESLKNILNHVHSYEGKFYVCSLNEQVQTIFELTNSLNIFNPLKNRQEFENAILS